MTTDADRALARLRAAHPEWQVWVVSRVVGGPVWCARRIDDDGRPPTSLINVSSSEDLAEAIAEAEAESRE